MSIAIIKSNKQEVVSSMESYFMFNLQTGNHSFLPRTKAGSNPKKEKIAEQQIFDPYAFYDSAMEKRMMLSALSA